MFARVLMLPLFAMFLGLAPAAERRPEKYVVQAVLNDEDPAIPGLPGEQSLVHRLYLINITNGKILHEVTLGSNATVMHRSGDKDLWVAEGLPSNDTRLREISMKTLEAARDFTVPVKLRSPIDPLARYLSNQQLGLVGKNQLILAGRMPATPPAGTGQFDLINVNVTKKKATLHRLTILADLHLDIPDFANINATSVAALFAQGDALSLHEDASGTVIADPSAGLTPLSLNAANAEGIRLAKYSAATDLVVAVTNAGTIFKGRLGAQNTTSFTSDSISEPEDLSLEPAGGIAAIRYKKDLNADTNALALIDVAAFKQIVTMDLPSDGAILQVDPTRTLVGDGSALKEIDSTNRSSPAVQTVFTFSGEPIHRILKIIPVIE